MIELLEKRKRVATASKPKQTGRSKRMGTDNDKRVTRAICLIRRGAISLTWKAMESKELGDLSNPAIFA
jgi:hypothetical protein